MIGAAVKVMKIATGEIVEDIKPEPTKSAAVELWSRGGKTRAASLSKEKRAEIAKTAYRHDDRRRRPEAGSTRLLPPANFKLRQCLKYSGTRAELRRIL